VDEASKLEEVTGNVILGVLLAYPDKRAASGERAGSLAVEGLWYCDNVVTGWRHYVAYTLDALEEGRRILLGRNTLQHAAVFVREVVKRLERATYVAEYAVFQESWRSAEGPKI
jgi:hypothetical protein